MNTSIIVLDIGTSGLRAALVDENGTIVDYEYIENPPSSPFAGLVEFDATELYEKSVDALARVVERNDRANIDALGITNQRASTIAWSAKSGDPIGPGIGWQDLRTVMECITAKSDHDIHLAPNQTATKAAWLIANCAKEIDTDDLRIGTVDTWLTWKLAGGSDTAEVFVTDHTNAAVTGLVAVETVDWDPAVCATLGVPIECLARVVASSEVVGRISGHGILDGIALASRVGDQQASLVGQGCLEPGDTKITFGTGGMLDAITGRVRPVAARRTNHGTFPIVAYSIADPVSSTRDIHWGVEAVMLSAGTNVEWLCSDMGLVDTPADSDRVAATVQSTDGVVYVPALLGLGTPDWDYGARGTLTGITRGTTAAHVVRAVLEGVAHRGADLLDATNADLTERGIAPAAQLRVDGGMSRNQTFIGLLADATGRSIDVSAETEATTLGAAYLAGTAMGLWPSLAAATVHRRTAGTVSPGASLDERLARRSEWHLSLTSARAWIPALSALDF